MPPPPPPPPESRPAPPPPPPKPWPVAPPATYRSWAAPPVLAEPATAAPPSPVPAVPPPAPPSPASRPVVAPVAPPPPPPAATATGVLPADVLHVFDAVPKQRAEPPPPPPPASRLPAVLAVPPVPPLAQPAPPAPPAAVAAALCAPPPPPQPTSPLTNAGTAPGVNVAEMPAILPPEPPVPAALFPEDPPLPPPAPVTMPVVSEVVVVGRAMFWNEPQPAVGPAHEMLCVQVAAAAPAGLTSPGTMTARPATTTLMTVETAPASECTTACFAAVSEPDGAHYEFPFTIGRETLGGVVSTLTRVAALEALTFPALSVATATRRYGTVGGERRRPGHRPVAGGGVRGTDGGPRGRARACTRRAAAEEVRQRVHTRASCRSGASVRLTGSLFTKVGFGAGGHRRGERPEPSPSGRRCRR